MLIFGKSVISCTRPPQQPSVVQHMYCATLPTAQQLHGIDRARYFAPVVFFAFLAALCLAPIAVSVFLVTVQNALPIPAAGAFGLLAAEAAGAIILRLQLRWLRYTTAIPIHTDREAALAALRELITEADWRITRQAEDGLEARTPDSRTPKARGCRDPGSSIAGGQHLRSHCGLLAGRSSALPTALRTCPPGGTRCLTCTMGGR